MLIFQRLPLDALFACSKPHSHRHGFVFIFKLFGYLSPLIFKAFYANLCHQNYDPLNSGI